MNNKVALVVGGAKGIGLAIAERLSAEGAKVFLTSRKGEEAERQLAASAVARSALPPMQALPKTCSRLSKPSAKPMAISTRWS